jgi:hypothetical protein
MPSHLHMICRRKAEAGLLSDLLRDFNRTGVPELHREATNENDSRK